MPIIELKTTTNTASEFAETEKWKNVLYGE